MGWLGNGFDAAQQWLFESLLQPVMFAVGLGNQLESGYEASGWILVGLLQLVVIAAVIGPLQHWRPVEAVTDRATIRTDILYTLIHRLGLFRLGLFLAVDPLMDSIFGALRVAGISTFQLDGLWPGFTDVPWVSLLLYLVVFDFVDYWIHRGQHHFEWWWRSSSVWHLDSSSLSWPSRSSARAFSTPMCACGLGAGASGCGSVRGFTGCTTASESAMRPSSHCQGRLLRRAPDTAWCWAGTTSAYCCPGGTC